jgi:hypothetical protein
LLAGGQRLADHFFAEWSIFIVSKTSVAPDFHLQWCDDMLQWVNNTPSELVIGLSPSREIAPQVRRAPIGTLDKKPSVRIMELIE